MRGRPSIARASGLALAAVRETFEETGFILGSPHNGAVPLAGRRLGSFSGHRPCTVLSDLHFFARAITPPGRTRRFDSRFFVVDAANIANLDARTRGTDELLETALVRPLSEAMNLDLPSITADILVRLQRRARPPGLAGRDDPVSFQYQLNGKWRDETL